MRKQGRIVRWDDARGFGFLRSAETPADVFFHVRDWAGGTQRPAAGIEVIYEEIHVGGKGPRGMSVRPVAQRTTPAPSSASRRASAATPSSLAPKAQRRPGAPTTGAGADPHPGPMLLLIVAYAALLIASVAIHRLPVAFALGVPILSTGTFFAYWRDKNAARQGDWRTSEQTLHVFGLLGGWPGAWLAHRVLRHKSRKTSFRAAYWATVALHCGAVTAWVVAGPMK